MRTSKGRDLLVLLNSDVRMGASVRGRGSVDPNGFVQSDYCMESVDIVVNPSFGRDVEISSKNLLESGNQFFEQNFLSEEDAKIRFRFARLSGYKNSFSEFLKGLKILKE